jgi:hypothetical protein
LELVQDVFGPLGITFNFNTFQNWVPAKSGSQSNFEAPKKGAANLQRWQRQDTYGKGNKMELVVWIVDSFDNKDLNGVSFISSSTSFSTALTIVSVFNLSLDPSHYIARWHSSKAR